MRFLIMDSHSLLHHLVWTSLRIQLVGILDWLEHPLKLLVHFTRKKATFSILHTHFYKTHTSVYLFYTFIQQNIHYFTIYYYSLSHCPSLSQSQTYHYQRSLHTQPPSSPPTSIIKKNQPTQSKTQSIPNPFNSKPIHHPSNSKPNQAKSSPIQPNPLPI